MQNKDDYFILHSNCIPVRGAIRSTICDLQLNRYRIIPNLLYDILMLSRKNSVADIKKRYNYQLDSGIDAYLKLLLKEDWGIYTDNPKEFPPIKLKWEHPSKITNAVIDFECNSNFSLDSALKDLDILGCEALQLRYFHEATFDSISRILNLLGQSNIFYIELLIKYDKKNTISKIKELADKNNRLRYILIYSSPFNKTNDFSNKSGPIIYYTTNKIVDKHNCGITTRGYFNIELKMFSESQHHNTCLNRKISIDATGEIRNCPSMQLSFGSIKNTSLVNAVNKKGFKKYWYMNKNQIDVCKDCEFRHICTDCRAYLQNEHDLFSKPLKCGYNPYTTNWKKASRLATNIKKVH